MHRNGKFWLCAAIVAMTMAALCGCDGMGKRRDITIQWPFSGVHKGVGYQSQPPYTTPEASNVRTVETLDGRRRGGRRPGLAKAFAAHTNSSPVRVAAQMTTAAADRFMMVSGGSKLYRESSGALSDVTPASGSLRLNWARTLQTGEMLQKLYIADYGYAGLYDTTGIQDLSATAKVLTMLAGTYLFTFECGLRAGAPINIYKLSDNSLVKSTTIDTWDVAAGTITVDDDTLLAGVAVYAHTERVPKVFDPADNTLTAWTATGGKGDVPLGCRLMCIYNGRIILAAPPEMPYAWYAGRQADPLDWLDTLDLADTTRPILSQNSNLGQIGEPITALMPHGDQYCLFGCSNSLWVLKGDPAYGGTMEPLSRTIGVVGPNAWCDLDDGSTVFLGANGLYAVTAGSAPVPISKDRLPQELTGLDPSVKNILLAYDPHNRGIHILTSLIASPYTEVSYWFDLVDKAFWPVALPSTMRPTAVCLQHQANGASRVLLGGRDGYLRYLSDSGTNDDGTAVTGTVTLGPFRMGGSDFHEGMLTKLVGILDAQSASLTWTVHVADTAEGAIAAAAHSTGTWTAGRSLPDYVRARGASMCIKLSGTGIWAIEQILAEVEQLGLVRAM